MIFTNLYHLRYFAVLARLEHYTQAAAELNITQPSLSHAISALEEELGVTLFDRVGRNVTLTKYGRLFLSDVEHSLSILDRGIDRLQRASAGQDIIDLGFLRGMGGTLVPEVVAAFQATEAGQKVEFRFRTDNTQGLLDGVHSKKYDLAFCSKNLETTVFDFFLVSRQPFCLVVHKDHPLARFDQIRLEDSLNYPHIIFTNTTGIRPYIDRLYAHLPHQPTIAYEVQEDQDIAGLVAHNFGVAVLPPITLLSSLPVKAIPLIEQDTYRDIYLAVPKGRYLSPAVTAFRDFVLQYTGLEKDR